MQISNTNNDYQLSYNQGKQENIITDDYNTYINKCNSELSPSYQNFVKNGGNLSFVDFAKQNNYGQEAAEESDTRNISINNDNSSNMFKIGQSSANEVNLKPGDILICHGTNSSGYFLGHEAIALSKNYVLEMKGKEGAKNNNSRTQKDSFLYNHLKQKGSYVQIYRMKSHPKYAKDAAQYAYNNMYLHNKIYYLTTTDLYNKDPSYCSKYVYLAYWWGTSHKGMEGNSNMHWIFPFTSLKVFSGSYHPNYIYKVTSF